MKKLFYLIATVALMCGCINPTDQTEDTTGSIYGVITDKATGEPMRASGVELYNNLSTLITKTVTGNEGQYEFDKLESGSYKLKVTISGYQDISYNVEVSAGKTSRADMQLVKLSTNMIVLTLDVTDIIGNSATLNGSYSYTNYGYADEVGFVYATQSNPANGGTRKTANLPGHSYSNGTYSFSTTIINLAKGTYYVQSYAKNSIGTEYGEIKSFQMSGNPSVTTLPATNVAANTATLNGKVEYQGDPAYTERGFVYSNSFQNPTVQDDPSATMKKVVAGTDTTNFSANVTGLIAETTYYVRAYATNSSGTVYGASLSFKPTAVTDYLMLQSEGIMVQKNDISSGADWTTANNLCKASTVGGYSDWRLPTRGELTALYNNRTTIGGFSNSEYWSGDKNGTNYYFYVYFGNGTVSNNYYSYSYRARAVRTLP